MCLLSREQSLLSRETDENAFLELCPVFDLDFLSSIKHPSAKHCHLHAVLMLNIDMKPENLQFQDCACIACLNKVLRVESR